MKDVSIGAESVGISAPQFVVLLAAYNQPGGTAALGEGESKRESMAFEVRKLVRSVGGRENEIVELFDQDRNVRAEVWPQRGFNCLRWQVRDRGGRLVDLLHVAPDWEANPIPTRSGHPVLFPFPGRLRDGIFTFEGRRFTLPLNDATRRHAIHGFTPRNAWRVTSTSAGDNHASVTGEFNLAWDLPKALPLWPTDFRLAITYTLFRGWLRVDAHVENLGLVPMPFGLGYHPYFHLGGPSDPSINRHVLQVNCGELWDAVDLLPTGLRVPIPEAIDFRTSRTIGATELDHILTVARSRPNYSSGLIELAELSLPDSGDRLRIIADPAFRELILFTPPHRQAIAIEPYTCSADAANLAERGIDCGWRVLAPDDVWNSGVEYHWQNAT